LDKLLRWNDNVESFLSKEVIIYRITTRADFDGLVAAALISRVEDVDCLRFTEPGPFQHGEIEVTSSDIITNLPYRPGCAMWFDHHISNKVDFDFQGSWWMAPSAARVIFEHYNSGSLDRYEELVNITDRIDSAALTEAELRDPKGYVLISMTIDGKVRLDELYWHRLINHFRFNDVEKTLADREVNRRCMDYRQLNQEYGEVIEMYSDMIGNILFTDFRNRWNGEQGNRFLAFTLYPSCDVWIKIMDYPHNQTMDLISVGRSIFKDTFNVNIGELLARYGGGGHTGAGGCRVAKED